jgi:DNA-binding winged helix-turn-helix (wHTH) protein/Tol biopolymer transport system component
VPGQQQPDELAFFADFALDARTGELSRDGRVHARLSDQPLQILVTLLSHPGELITREELQKKLWPNNTVVEFEHSINTAINRLRVALGDSARNARFIETLARKGYRWKVPVEWRDHAAVSATKPSVVLKAQPLSRSFWLLAATALLIATGLFLSWTRSDPSRNRTIADWRQRQLTVNSVDNPLGGGSISPDGKLLAFSDFDGMHVRPFDSNDLAKIPDPPVYANDPPVWEIGYWLPDSHHFLAIAERPHEPSALWLLSVNGEPASQLGQDANPWAVTPDGVVALTLKDDHEIWELDTKSGAMTPLLKGVETDRYRAASWSPDGQRLAYIRNVSTPAGNASHIEVLDRKSHASRELASGPAIRALSELAEDFQDLLWFSADRIIFVGGESDIRGVSCNLWQITLDSRRAVTVSVPEKLTNWAGFGVTFLTKTADGKRLVFSRWSDSMNVLISDYNSSAYSISPPQRLTLTEDLSFTLAWTLDASGIFLQSNRLGSRTGIFRQSLNRTDADLVFATEGQISSVAVTPDRQWILFQRSESAKGEIISHLMRAAVSGGPEMEVLAGRSVAAKCGRSPGARCVLAEVSPTENGIVYSELDPLHGKGKELGRVFHNHANETRWSLSPDGNQIALFDDLTKSLDVFSFPDKSTRNIRLSPDTHLRSVTWSAAGDGFFICSAVNKGAELLFVDFEGNSHKLWELVGGAHYLQAQPAPDGRHLAIDAPYKNSNLWVMEDF